MINSDVTKNKYTGNGSQLEYSVTFPFYTESDISVYVSINNVESKLTLNTNYTVSINSDNSGGTVSFKSTALVPNGCLIAILLDLSKTQEVDLSSTANVNTSSLETGLDRIVQLVQMAFETLGRCVTVGPTSLKSGDALNLSTIIDAVETQSAAALLAADSAQNSASLAEEAARLASSVVAFTFYPYWSGAKSRTIASKLGDTVSVFDFGAVGDGVTDDTAAIQAAIDYCASLPNGGSVVIPAPSAYYSVSRINAKSKVSIVIPNASTKIVQEKGTTWDTQTSLGVGGYFGSDYTTPTAYALNSISLGDKTTTLSTESDATNFQVGDCVFIESTTNFTVSTYTVPAFAQMNVVESISGGVLTLRHPIQESRSTVQIRNFSRTGMLTQGGTQSLEAVRDFKLIGGTWINKYGSFNADGGCIDCEISPDAVEAVHGAPFGNCYSHTRFRVGRVISTGVPFALALAAHNTVVEIGHISCISPTTIQRLVELSEGCRDCTVRIGSIAVAAPIVNAVEIVTGRRNIIDIGSISVETVSGAAVYIWNPAYSGTEIPPANNNTISINSIISPSIAGGSVIAGTTTEVPSGNVISIFCIGTVTTDESCSNSGRNIVDVKTQRRQTLERLQFDEFPFSVTSTSAYTKTIIIPAGIVRTGDRLNIRIRGISTGAAGTKTISITFAGVTMYSYIIPASHFHGIDIDFILNFSNDSVALSNTTAIQEGVANSDDVAASGLSLATTAYNLVVSITCAAAGDTVAIRQATLNVSRKVIP